MVGLPFRTPRDHRHVELQSQWGHKRTKGVNDHRWEIRFQVGQIVVVWMGALR